jgi:hypothetical protein
MKSNEPECLGNNILTIRFVLLRQDLDLLWLHEHMSIRNNKA